MSYFPRSRFQKIILGLIGLSIAISGTRLQILSLIILVLIGSLYIPFPTRLKSPLTRIILSFIFLGCISQIFGIILWLLKIPTTTLITTLLYATCIGVVSRSFSNPIIPSAKYIFRDIYPLAIACLSIGVIIAGLVFNAPNKSQQILRYTSSGFDNAIHISLMLTTYKSKGYVYGPFNEISEEIVYKDINGYPQGWHYANTTYWRAIGLNISSSRAVLAAYVVTLLLWYGILVFLMTKLAIVLSRTVSDKVDGRTIGLLASMLVLGSNILFLYSLLRYGFANYIGLVAILLATILIVCYSQLQGSNKDDFRAGIYIAILLSVGMSLTWLLAAPIGFLLVSLALIQHVKNFGELRKWLLADRLGLVVIFGLCAIFLTQVYIQLKFGEKGQLSEDGGISIVSRTLVTSLAGICTGGYALIQQTKRAQKIFSWTAPGAFALAGGVYIVQYLTLGTAHYYSTKLLLLVLILLYIFSIPFIIMIARRATMGNRLGTFVLVSSIVLFLPTLTGADLSFLRVLKPSQYRLSNTSSSQILSIIDENGKPGNIIVFKKLDYEEDVITTNLMDVISRKRLDCKVSVIWGLMSKNDSIVLEGVESCAANLSGNEKIYVISSSASENILRGRFLSNDKVVIVKSN